MNRRGVGVATAVLTALPGLLGACGQGPAEPGAGAAPTESPGPTEPTDTTDSADTTSPDGGPATTRGPATTLAPTTTTRPPYSADVATIDQATAQRMTYSWRSGCPVPLADLRLLTLAYHGFDGLAHRGELVVHADVAEAVAGVFGALYDARFPIERMELVDVYGGSDDLSTMANNTSAFNCRAVTGGSRWSEHAYGRAIDVNPVQNPYVYSDGHVLDPNAARYTDRSLQEPGMIHDDDLVVQAFAAIGWDWGGDFDSIKDYQHFSATGR